MGKLWRIFSIVIFVSCHQQNNSSKKIFHYNESAGITTLDPAFAKNQALMWPVHQLYNTLVEVSENNVIVPSLSKNWNFSEDKKTISFLLRDDVYFHEDDCFGIKKSRRLIAADVVYSLAESSIPKRPVPAHGFSITS